MALAVTAPVPVTHSGESDPAQYPQVIAGTAFPDIVGTTDTSGGNVEVTISGENAGATVKVTVVATVFAFTTAGKLAYTPSGPGMYQVSVKDVTSGNTVVTNVQVFGSEGV
jgi:hypothetical protein